ncbi:MAG: NAD-dependent deacetylase, partial [Lentisphaeria bacterium]|nr:NAD-dependent deacetylase [Lentisphaeria bacterium]
HGSPAHHHCLSCNKYYSYNDIAPVVQSGKCPQCECGGIIKPGIIFYGEQLDSGLLEQAFSDFASADIAIVLGSSLTVNPAALLPQYTIRGGGKLAIINSQETTLDRFATWRFADLSETFTALAALSK